MTLLCIKDVIWHTTLARATIYRLEAAGLFPPRRNISENRVVWLRLEIDEWLLSRPPTIQGLAGFDYPVEYPVRVMTEKQVLAYTTLGRANLNRMYRAGQFPPPRQLSSHKIGWLKHEVDAWIRNLPGPSVSPSPLSLGGPDGTGPSQPPAFPPSA